VSSARIKEQRLLVRLLKPAFVAAFLIPGLDHRLGWSRALLGDVPLRLSLIVLLLVAGSWLMVFWVFRVNNFAGRTIEVEAGQRVISSGSYALVRHPVYAASVVMFLFLPLALGSYVAWAVFALLIPFYVYRLLNEEKFSKRNHLVIPNIVFAPVSALFGTSGEARLKGAVRPSTAAVAHTARTLLTKVRSSSCYCDLAALGEFCSPRSQGWPIG
jgi:protein-S-isoprenylcysteine O-methyltransferase Ste14